MCPVRELLHEGGFRRLSFIGGAGYLLSLCHVLTRIYTFGNVVAYPR